MILKVRKYGDPILRRKADPIPAVTPEIKGLIADMIETMYDQVGIGLAAPQVGIPLRLIVVDDNTGGGARPLIDPAITARRGSVEGEEGCLSIPGIFAPVMRAEWVKFEALDADGALLELEASGLLARVIQHEIDHLDGILFIDRLDKVTRDRIKRKIKKEGLPDEAPHSAFAL
ncbi:MAG: peptide deformylase [Candidatus Rokubacteria bacterium]|nr:peptide deformylase [Candidatus Rokubacteria bacterium]MBI2553376.1 peptide deformylase [Candidatus Rokubacteria bacterium]